MDKVIVKKEDLLHSLKTNLDFHIEDFAEMLLKRRNEIFDCFEKELLNLGEIKYQPKPNFHFPMPEDHKKDYEKAIRMVEMSVSDEIELTDRQFDQLVMDNRSWSIGNDLLKTQYLGK